MNRFRSIIALLLVSLWLPALGHCSLELLTAGHDEVECCGSDHQAETREAHCLADHCELFETGLFRDAEDATPMAGSGAPFHYSVEQAHSVAAQITVARTCRPPPAAPDTAHSWQFRERAAAQPRAPGITD